MAGCPEQAVLGTCIANMWARPAPTAHAAAPQLDQAYPGRFVLGLGVGYEQQAVSVGREFGSPVTTAGAYLRQLADVPCPLILAANRPRMLGVAGELADGALPAGGSPAATAAARAALGAEALLVVYAGGHPSDTTSTAAAVIDAHLDAGADHVIVGLPATTDLATAVDHLQRLAPGVVRYRD